MKIGLVCPYNVARGGAVQEIVKEMSSGLTALGHEVKIITGQPKTLGDMDTSGMVFLGTATDFRSPTHTLASFSMSVDMEAVEQMIEAEQFDILHFHEPWVPVLSRQILSRSKSVNIATFHAQVPETVFNRTLTKVVTPYLKSFLKDLHEMTAVSEAAAEYVSTLTDRPISLIPNAINLDDYKHTPRAKTGSPKKILYVGRLEHRKGVKYLLQAYQILSQDEEDVSLIIAGDGPDREKLELLAEELDLRNITFLGYVSHELKLQLLAEADLFCSPAIFGESFGIVLLEAMATGLVTVAGNNAGYSSVMQELGAISLVNPRDSVDFARRLKLLLEETELRQLWQSWAHEYVQQFDYAKIIKQYDKLYRTALKEHGRKTVAS